MKAVIFDMDGVIINSEPIHFQVEKTIFYELGFQLSKREHEGLIGINTYEMFSQLKIKHQFENSVESLTKEGRERYLKVLKAAPLPLIDGIPEIMAGLEEAGYLLAVASSSPHEQINLVMERSGLAPFVTARISGDDVEKSKPDPAIFLKTAGILGISPGDCWVIEDSENGIHAAKLAGMQCIAYENPGSGSQNLREADYIISSISEAAAIIVDGPAV